jgi:hypothetical protein
VPELETELEKLQTELIRQFAEERWLKSARSAVCGPQFAYPLGEKNEALIRLDGHKRHRAVDRGPLLA